MVPCVFAVAHTTLSDPDIGLRVYLMGNPAVVWGSSASILLWLVASAVYLHIRDVVKVPPKLVHALSMCR
jgi:hypothetical protein